MDIDVAPGVRLRALDWGGPDPAVVLLHPNGFCPGLYEPLANRLRQVARPIAIDLRGHGASTAPTGADSYAFEQLAADVVAVLDALGLHGVVGVVDLWVGPWRCSSTGWIRDGGRACCSLSRWRSRSPTSQRARRTRWRPLLDAGGIASPTGRP